MNFKVDSVLILTFIALFFLFYIISQHKGVEKKTIQKDKDIVRPSYGDEFYNYSGGDRILFKKEKINTQEEDVYKETELIEGFTGNIVSNEVIISNHGKCPETGGDTVYTSCIHYPNRVIRGLDEIIDYGFLVSVSHKRYLDKIQQSLENGHGMYDLIYENDQMKLTKNNKTEQILIDCNATNLFRVTQLVGTTSV